MYLGKNKTGKALFIERTAGEARQLKGEGAEDAYNGLDGKQLYDKGERKAKQLPDGTKVELHPSAGEIGNYLPGTPRLGFQRPKSSKDI
ncbi:hypothetical protein [Motilimonas sp. E26]|uniref:hypothetical protein n=1 Tax=Motilimonas sp. E26 TaxID=2865674 RepID=UPI001E527525|nr:hypothetical protein [Motilimonas sp. E26]MCE0556141.1 hypothetical protein [Motilimonas sp. E26]